MSVVTSREGDVLLVTLDNPPVNALSAAVRAGIRDAVRDLAADEGLRAAVLIGARDTFVGGSDISEFGGAVPDPLLPAVIRALEECPKPVVAAIDGYALGGGLELALGCDLRLATARSRLGLPEVTLGMVPGAGGTQRLPRLAGRPESLRLILTGTVVDGPAAAAVGVVDHVVDGDLRAEAVAHARRAVKRVVAGLPVPDDDVDLDDLARTTVRGEHRPNVTIAVRLVREAGTVPVEEALRRERAEFDVLRTAPDAAALRHVFFAERVAPRRAGLRPGPQDLRRVGVVGAGAMGAGIGAAFAAAGVPVQLVDADADQAAAGMERVGKAILKATDRGALSHDLARECRAASAASTRLEDLAGVGLVIEAVVERTDVKAEVFARAAEISPGATLATNTSYLGVADLARDLADPSRLVGLHFFNPADVMKLVEVIPTQMTADAHTELVLGVAKRLGKVAVIAGDAEGFVANRVHAAYRRHAEYLLEDGAEPAQIDAAMRRFGFAMGPFAVADLSGLQIAQSLRRRWRAEGRLPARYVDIPDLLCDLGRLGRRTGRGYYRYDSGRAEPDPEVVDLVHAESLRKGIRRREQTDETIVRRLVGAMVVEGARVVHEGVALHPDDVDVAMVDGLGFPRFRGGPMWWARTLTHDERAAAVHSVAEAAHEDIPPSLVEGALGSD